MVFYDRSERRVGLLSRAELHDGGGTAADLFTDDGGRNAGADERAEHVEPDDIAIGE